MHWIDMVKLHQIKTRKWRLVGCFKIFLFLFFLCSRVHIVISNCIGCPCSSIHAFDNYFIDIVYAKSTSKHTNKTSEDKQKQSQRTLCLCSSFVHLRINYLFWGRCLGVVKWSSKVRLEQQMLHFRAEVTEASLTEEVDLGISGLRISLGF